MRSFTNLVTIRDVLTVVLPVEYARRPLKVADLQGEAAEAVKEERRAEVLNRTAVAIVALFNW